MDPLVVNERKELWLSRFTDLAESGQTQRQWCMENNIPISTLRYWIRKLRIKEERHELAPKWVQLPAELPVAEQSGQPHPCLKFYVDGVCLECPDDLSVSKLTELLKVMKQL